MNQKDANIAEMSRVLVDNENYFERMGSGGKGGGNHQRTPKSHHRPNRGSRMDEQELDLSSMRETIGELNSFFYHTSIVSNML